MCNIACASAERQGMVFHGMHDTVSREPADEEEVSVVVGVYISGWFSCVWFVWLFVWSVYWFIEIYWDLLRRS